MIAYNETIKQFNIDVINNDIINKISRNLNAGKSEQYAWQDAAIYMKNILELSNLPDDVEIGMELKIPVTNNRIDFLIAGLNENDEKSLLVVELKRWSSVSKSDKENLVNADDTRYGQDSLHPSYQAYSYKINLEAYNETIINENIEINSCSYLHNLRQDKDIKDEFYKEILEKSPIFSANDNQKLANFIKRHIVKAHHNKLLFQIENSKIKPSEMLMNTLEDELNNNKVFTLLGRQEISYQNIRKIIKDNNDTDQKQVIIVRGGAGTGKSVIAIKVLNDFIQQEKLSFYVTKNSAVRTVYGKKLAGKRNEHLRSLFMSIITISRDRPVNEYDCLVVDEAHRLPQRSQRGHVLWGQDLIREIIQSTKYSIFFIDEKQQVDIRDYATIEQITKTAEQMGAKVHDNENLRLEAQFRCSGNDEYINIVDSILYNEEPKYEKLFDYDVRVFDDINEWHEKILEKIDTTPNSRMLAGDVFDWITRDDDSLFDIEIGDVKLQWNKNTYFSAYENQKYRVGHIDSVQGLEFDYIGLIIGDDLTYNPDTGKVETNYLRHPERAGHFRRHGRRAPLEEDLPTIDKIIRNTYNVLLKRGIKGCYIYCMDKNLSEYLKRYF